MLVLAHMTVALPGTLNDQVYENLKRRLVRRQLGPGEKVSLHELASYLLSSDAGRVQLVMKKGGVACLLLESGLVREIGP